MTLSNRVRANRANARQSTGPKTAAGKARVAGNAVQHGLAVPVTSDQNLAGEIERWTRFIAGHHASPARTEAARRIAEAEVDIIRIRRVRNALLAGLPAPMPLPSDRELLAACKAIREGAPLNEAGLAMFGLPPDFYGRPRRPRASTCKRLRRKWCGSSVMCGAPSRAKKLPSATLTRADRADGGLFSGRQMPCGMRPG
jgi:hypothetical protein